MKDFADLFTKLDQTNKTNPKVAYLQDYFQQATSQDIMWALALFTGKRPKRPVSTPLLRQWCAGEAGIPLWLFEDSYYVVGDLAETISLTLPEKHYSSTYQLTDWIYFIQDLDKQDDETKQQNVLWAWRQLDQQETFVFTKLMTGGYRIGVSQRLMVRALSHVTQLPTTELMHKLMGQWHPAEVSFDDLFYSQDANTDISRPYPFFLAHQIDEAVADFSRPEEWHAEWKWDGIRAQVIYRQGQLYAWSRGEELITDRYPELHVLANSLPDGTVIDGELLPYSYEQNRVLPFNVLQTRIGRKKVTHKLMREAPVALMAYDLLEHEGSDIRNWSLEARRSQLSELVNEANQSVLRLSPVIPFQEWDELEAARQQALDHLAEGLMIKRQSSPYQVGRTKGDWWKWKVDPFTVDAVMIYAQRGHGRRANLYSDYTFAVWNDAGDQLIPFTKAYSGVSDKELREIDRWVKRNTIEQYGPVRAVTPYWVFELAFEGIQRSNRHKSGLALRFPRMYRWRQDLSVKDADNLSYLYELLERYFETA